MSGCSHATALIASALVQCMTCDAGAEGVERLGSVSVDGVSVAMLAERAPLARRLADAIMSAHPGTIGVLSADVAHQCAASTLTADVRLLVVGIAS